MRPLLQVLSAEEVRKIHETSLGILDSLGMRLPGAEAHRLLEEAGAQVGEDGIARIPARLVEEALRSAPKREEVVLFGREPRHDLHLAKEAPSFSSMTMATHVLDPETGGRRSATRADVVSLTRIIEQLDHVGVSGAPVTPQEVPGEVCDWYTWADTLKNTTKHVTGGLPGARAVRDAVQMAAAAAGGESAFRSCPCISGWVLTLPPLQIDALSLEALIELARWGVPAMVSSGPIMGASSPMSVAGTLAQAHAEVLACLVVAQLANPGAPVVYTSFARSMDMRTANVSMGGPEFGILKVGMAQLGHSLDLPVRMPGLLRDAKALDAQAGFETGLTGSLTALSADLIDAMQFDMDLLVDYADLVFANECMGALRRISRGVNVDADSLAVEILREVGHGGAFLGHKHTFERFRQELWEPALFERRNWEAWDRDGARDVRARALERARILGGAEPPPLPPGAAEEMDRLVREAERDLVGSNGFPST